VLGDLAVVTRWMVRDGTRVRPPEAVCRLENDGAFFDVEVAAAGTLRHLVVAGERVKPGDVLALILPLEWGGSA
jgi:pyruvate/2-oxoglutarate dehydrogenase complex dihydrolipoamide acyltransferase (E2) component